MKGGVCGGRVTSVTVASHAHVLAESLAAGLLRPRRTQEITSPVCARMYNVYEVTYFNEVDCKINASLRLEAFVEEP